MHLVLNAGVTVAQMKNLKNQLQKELDTFEFVHTTIKLNLQMRFAGMKTPMVSVTYNKTVLSCVCLIGFMLNVYIAQKIELLR